MIKITVPYTYPWFTYCDYVKEHFGKTPAQMKFDIAINPDTFVPDLRIQCETEEEATMLLLRFG